MILKEFVPELQQNILPIYAKHESAFDPWGIHGRMHICRALIFSETMRRIYTNIGVSVDAYAVWVAIAFHDSGREGNGPDLWEKRSAERCYSYLLQLPESMDQCEARIISNRILKHGTWDLPQRIIHDADVLEIMRPCCGHGGLDGFRRDVLHFSGPRDPDGNFEDNALLREQLILEAWSFIQETENLKDHFSSSTTYMDDLLNCLRQQKKKYPCLSCVLDN